MKIALYIMVPCKHYCLFLILCQEGPFFMTSFSHFQKICSVSLSRDGFCLMRVFIYDWVEEQPQEKSSSTAPCGEELSNTHILPVQPALYAKEEKRACKQRGTIGLLRLAKLLVQVSLSLVYISLDTKCPIFTIAAIIPEELWRDEIESL